MQGLMQDWPLTVDKMLDHAKNWHPHREVVTRSVEGPIVRTTYGEIHGRAKQVSNALKAWGIGNGDRVATLAWNTWRHLGGHGTASWASARSATPSIRACSPIRSSGSSTMPKTAS
jgi:acyl-CoA synthetase (AMP-forming)/AMP-acid ligase II